MEDFPESDDFLEMIPPDPFTQAIENPEKITVYGARNNPIYIEIKHINTESSPIRDAVMLEAILSQSLQKETLQNLLFMLLARFPEVLRNEPKLIQIPPVSPVPIPTKEKPKMNKERKARIIRRHTRRIEREEKEGENE